jgi:hypothetical protein
MLAPLRPLSESEPELARSLTLGKIAGAGDAAPLPPQTPPSTPQKGLGLRPSAFREVAGLSGRFRFNIEPTILDPGL